MSWYTQLDGSDQLLSLLVASGLELWPTQSKAYNVTLGPP